MQSLEQLAKSMEPAQMTAAEKQEKAEQVDKFRSQRQIIERVTDLKEIILQQLKDGQSFQFALYNTLECIGLLTNDKEWADAGKAEISEICDDLAQQSFIINQEIAERERLQTKHREQLAKMKKRNQTSINACNKILRELQAVKNSLEKEEAENFADYMNEALK